MPTAAISHPEPSSHPTTAAEALSSAGVEVLLPADPEFTTRQASYWSNTAKAVTPSCIARPRSAQEVSAAVRALVAAEIPFAVRSGGHTQWAGASSIDGGATLDLGLLDWTRYDGASETVDIGPGARWRQVYGALRPHRRVVSGGRDGNVGVAGVVLGGGYTFYAARRGFACDDVVAFEVALADGRIVTADAGGHCADLFAALKGGSNNFGVVTNVRMNAIGSDRIWGGLNFFPKQLTSEATQALVHFTDHVNEDEDSHLLFFFTYTEVTIVAAYVQLAGVERAPAYDKFLAMPSIMDTTKMTDVAAVVSEYDIAPLDYYNTFFTASFKNDVTIVAKAAELHEQLVEELNAFIPDGDFITQCLLQPLPTLYGQKSAKAGGGNIMGVEDQPVNGLLFVAVIMVKTPEQEAFAYPKAKAWLEALKAFASTIENGNLRWIYLNYADKSQKVLESYGAANVQRMRQVAAKYDPEQVFQRLCPGGFKISEVKDDAISPSNP